ncbi:Uma2 family endonuclease [Ruania alba]|uniref:Endonuclease, Uma2 family (Restriction endonuclease fold) n=1 Tax=Ruania alba TaxID=648782 RepID=A0A1H5LAK1_9MICO|nr:Uma2 family endonuclease [Ruania alba]SEE73980.1 Endonuclease, Uma2 family (restriction endonuclease fold) [Ruania alba]
MDVMTATHPAHGHPEVIVREGPYTVAERDAVPDDGLRHELLDGVLVMSPAPTPRHQRAVRNLTVAMDRALPGELEVFGSPIDVRLGRSTVLQPDVVVVHRDDVGELGIVGVPVLAIEVLSPSTQLFDLHRKKQLLEQAGCPSYWVLDPHLSELTAWQRSGGRYREVARVSGTESWTATQPCTVSLEPSLLLED